MTGIGNNAFTSCDSLGSVTLSANLTSVGAEAFSWCRITRLVIPASIGYLGDLAFACNWNNLGRVYLLGNAPATGSDVFSYDDSVVFYTMPGTTGWDSGFCGRTPVSWNPHALSDADFGVRSNAFGFRMGGSDGIEVTVERCTNLLDSAWTPVSTQVLSSGSAYFRDPQSSNCASSVYRFRVP